jgi:hypothetical protein
VHSRRLLEKQSIHHTYSSNYIFENMWNFHWTLII